MILAGDVGGNKVNLAMFEKRDGELVHSDPVRFNTNDYPGIAPILHKFIADLQEKPDKICLGVAGPVENGTCRLTNVSWEISAHELKQTLNVPEIYLINDLEAMACGVPFLKPSQLESLQTGSETSSGPIGVIAAGTGLGEALLIPGKNESYQVLPTEAGQVDFAPHSKEALELLRFLMNKQERVATEHILSGPGIFNIYEFIKEYNSHDEPEWLTGELERENPAEVIARSALSKKNPACEQTVDLFISIYGAVAGNLALQCMTLGGVFIGGGIAPKLLPGFKDGRFIQNFISKGSFDTILRRIPVSIIMDEVVSLYGAAHWALGDYR